MPDVQLSLMSEIEYSEYLARGIRAYADDNVKAGRWGPEESLKLAEDAYKQMLPQGTKTKDQYLFGVRDKVTGNRVGIAWLGFLPGESMKVAFIYDIEMDEAFRGRGFGTATMNELEDKARKLGATRIALNVFSHNPGAVRLYRRLGYEVISSNMAKGI